MVPWREGLWVHIAMRDRESDRERTALCLEIAARALKLSGVCLRNEQGVLCLGGGKNPLFNMAE